MKNLDVSKKDMKIKGKIFEKRKRIEVGKGSKGNRGE
jgi:hypothetical protein